ncbi:MAG: helix-turn-helix domain-containing protein [Eggerthellaceae bacterium]|nr:helix-turn-helix domain-containing protein [Eggerthellaceae bacterium]
MFLSMWIIEENLVEYTTENHIVEGPACIRNASVLYRGDKVSNHTVYVCPSETFIATLINKVICVCRNDYIVVDSDDFEAVFDDVIEIIDRYAEWDMEARDLIEAGCTLQQLMEFGAGFLKRVVGVADAGFIYLAIAGQNYSQLPEEAQIHLEVGDGLPLEYAREFLDVYRHHPEDLSIFQAAYSFYESVALGKNVTYNGQVWGCCIMTTDRSAATKADYQIMAALASQTEKWMEVNAAEDEAPSYSRLLARAIASTTPASEDELQEYFNRLGWDALDSKYFLIIRPMQRLGFHYLRLRNHVSKSYPGCLFIDLPDETVAIVVNSSYLPIERLVDYIQSLFGEGIHAGISYPFESLGNIGAARRQAETAVGMCTSLGKQIVFCNDCILMHIRETLYKRIGYDQIHPALKRLMQGGGANRSYLQTLETYLVNERSIVKTAKALSIHPNTLKYRLAKIQDLYPLDLDDGDDRMYLLLSFQIMRGAEHGDRP